MGTDIAFPLPGGRWSRRDRMRVGIVGCNGHRTGGWGHPPLRRVTMDFVGAAVPSGPSITAAPPWSPSSVMAAPCHLLPCGAKAMGRAILAFPLPGGRCPRRGRMRVGIVGCIRPRRAAEDSGPYGQGSSHSVGADVPIRPERFVRQRRAADSRPYKRPGETAGQRSIQSVNTGSNSTK